MAIEPEFDLYDDLDDAFTEPLEKDVEKKKAEEHQKLLAATETAEKCAKLEKDYQQLKDENLQINKNLSLFTLTAKNEISRKDQQIKDLRRELDGMIFRRNKVKGKVCEGTVTCDKFVQTEERSLGPKMFTYAEKSACDRTKVNERREKSSERSNKSNSQQRSREPQRDRRYEREHSSKDQKSSSRDEERKSSSRKTSRDEQLMMPKKQSSEEKSKSYRKYSTDAKKRSDDDLKSQKLRRDSRGEPKITKFDDAKKSHIRLTDPKDPHHNKNRKRSRSRSVEKNKSEKRSKYDEQKQREKPKVADLRETLLKKEPNRRNEPRRESPRKNKQSFLNSAEVQVPVETVATAVPQKNPIETVTSTSSPSKDSIPKESKLELKASAGIEGIEITEPQSSPSKDGKTKNTEISKIPQIIEVSIDQNIEQPEKEEKLKTPIQDNQAAPSIELEEGEIKDDEITLEPVSTLQENENANISRASNFASLNVSAFSDVAPKILDESAKNPITLANDSLNSSGSKENSLNRSQENSKSKKRASYEKEVGQDGSVVLTIHRKTKKIKKKKNSA